MDVFAEQQARDEVEAVEMLSNAMGFFVTPMGDSLVIHTAGGTMKLPLYVCHNEGEARAYLTGYHDGGRRIRYAGDDDPARRPATREHRRRREHRGRGGFRMTDQPRDIIAALAFGLLDDLRATSKAQDRMLENALRENELLRRGDDELHQRPD